jgi:uncharacterized protein YkwD
VGLADREYMRTPIRSRGASLPLLLLAGIILLGLLAYSPSRHWLQGHLGNDKPQVITVKPLGIGPSFQLGSPYPIHDKWASFLPDSNACPDSTKISVSPSAAESAMVCVLNYARQRDGLRALPVSPLLARSAELKALDIIRCQDFSHTACGKNARAVADEVGYPQVSWGENILYGGGPFRPARVAGDGWLNSEHHRENLFRPEWTEQGVALMVAKEFKGQRKVFVWVSEFGAS